MNVPFISPARKGLPQQKLTCCYCLRKDTPFCKYGAGGFEPPFFLGQVEGTSPENGKSPVVLQAHRNKHVSAIPALVHIHLRRSVHSFGDQCIPLSRACCLRDLIPSQVYKSLGAETLGDCGREMFICKGI